MITKYETFKQHRLENYWLYKILLIIMTMLLAISYKTLLDLVSQV